MNLLSLRDRIRTKAIANSLTYTEIETLFDVNELLNQSMPCLAWRYSGETNNFDEVGTEMSLNIYLLTEFPDSVKTETADYQRDYIVTQQDALRTFFYTWLQAMPFESGSDFLEVLSTEEIPIAERLSINAFLTMEFRVNISIKRDFCVEPEEIAPTADEVKVYFNSVLKYTQACNVDLQLTLKNQDGDDITAAFTGYDIVVTQPVAADASVNNSDSSYTASVASGGTLALPDITISNSNDSFTTTSPSVKNVDLADITVSNSDDSYSVTSPSAIDVDIPDESITVNSTAFITKPSKKDQDILLKDVSGTTITPESLSGNTITILDAVVNTGWSRPADWLTMPTIVDKVLYGLVLVFEDGQNEIRVEAPFNRIEWDFENDGTIVTSNGFPQTYTYDYSSLSGVVSVYTEDGTNRNYKQVIFKAEQVGGFTNETTWELHNNMFADIRCSFAGLYPRIQIHKNPYLRIIECTNQGTTKTRCWNNLSYLNLEQFICPSPINIYGTQSGLSINQDLDNVIGGATFNNARFKNINSTNCKLNSTDASAIGNITIGNNGIDRFMSSTFEVTGTIACTATNVRRLFNNSTSKKLIFSSFPANPTSMNLTSSSRPFGGCTFLEELILPNCESGFSIINGRMGATALDALFTSLGTASGTQTITITGNPGAATCTTSIATAKGFTIVI